ncbi:MAG: pyridoxamine 5'-phosphate oxidase family protein [Deferrisomatales bacterium]
MRRKEREITHRGAIDEIIRRSSVCHLALADGARPYVVPLSFGYDGTHLYFHSAPEGRKIELLRRNDAVGFAFVPEGEQRVVRAPRPCRWGVSYRSVVGTGRARILEDREAKRRGLEALMAHYGAGPCTFGDREVDGVTVIRVEIEELTGKGTEGAPSGE